MRLNAVYVVRPLSLHITAMTAAALVRDEEVRAAFEKICWVSVGQEPDTPALQNTLHIQHSLQQVTVECTSILRCADRATDILIDGVRGNAVRGKVLKIRVRLQPLPFRVSDLTSEAHILSPITAFLLKRDSELLHCAGERVLEARLKRAFLRAISI